ncbi:unnamed protein product [Blepharisma stoltei]|uniref:Swt1-like HEPN domain-containing protein n=1 Tax=Blepharisma stoltei TaxID=1481888 RepID=A0AAU9IV38_9CILI|nr:unnamed protein product [Blepharisma stoltei]
MTTQILNDGIDFFREKFVGYLTLTLKEKYGSQWMDCALNPPGQDSLMSGRKNSERWDIQFSSQIFHAHWDSLYKDKVDGKFPKALMTLIKFYRNEWAHQSALGNREVYRAIDAMQWMLESLKVDAGLLENSRNNLMLEMCRQSPYLQMEAKVKADNSAAKILSHNRSDPRKIQAEVKPAIETKKLTYTIIDKAPEEKREIYDIKEIKKQVEPIYYVPQNQPIGIDQTQNLAHQNIYANIGSYNPTMSTSQPLVFTCMACSSAINETQKYTCYGHNCIVCTNCLVKVYQYHGVFACPRCQTPLTENDQQYLQSLFNANYHANFYEK